MPRYLALVVALALAVPPAHGLPCGTTKPAKRARVKGNAKGKKAKDKEARAKAQLEKAQRLPDRGKKDWAVELLRKTALRWPRTKAGFQALLILRFTEP